jgi:serine/threonine protein kinase
MSAFLHLVETPLIAPASIALATPCAPWFYSAIYSEKVDVGKVSSAPAVLPTAPKVVPRRRVIETAQVETVYNTATDEFPESEDLTTAFEREALIKKLARTHRFVKRLGQGSNGEVYLMETTRTGRPVVCKVTYDAVYKDLDALYTEAAIMKKLRKYKHVATYLSHRLVGNHFVMFMSCANQGALQSRMINKSRLKQKDAKKYLFELALALAACEKEGVIHRDIKPENVLLNNGKAWLADFGLSYNAPVAPFEYDVQTHCFRAPEVFAQQPHSIKADVWSFGITAIFALKGKIIDTELLRGPNIVAMIKKIVFNGRMNKDLNEMLQGVFAVDSEDRYSAQELVGCKYFKDLRCSDDYKQALKQISGPNRF